MLIFSGVWPYSKQIITLVLWFLPPTTVSVAKRGNIFLWLDLLAKWSMVDVFVMIVSIVAFRVTIKRYVGSWRLSRYDGNHALYLFESFLTPTVSSSPLHSPNQTFLPEDLYRVEMLVVPLWGLYANMMVSCLLSDLCEIALP
jgi:hypothetical protein